MWNAVLLCNVWRRHICIVHMFLRTGRDQERYILVSSARLHTGLHPPLLLAIRLSLWAWESARITPYFPKYRSRWHRRVFQMGRWLICGQASFPQQKIVYLVGRPRSKIDRREGFEVTLPCFMRDICSILSHARTLCASRHLSLDARQSATKNICVDIYAYLTPISDTWKGLTVDRSVDRVDIYYEIDVLKVDWPEKIAEGSLRRRDDGEM